MSGDVISMDEINDIRNRRVRALHALGCRGAELATKCGIDRLECDQRQVDMGLSLEPAAPVLRGSRPRRAQS